jgi:xanthine dehydrogenase small subunit
MRAGSSSLEFVLNGSPIAIDQPSMPMTLLEFLRARGLTAAKEGCAEGECGACAIAMVTSHRDGSAYRVVNSCLMPVPIVAGREIYTVESLAHGAVAGDGSGLADAQAAMAAAGGSQCGYCTPGFVMSLFGEQYRPDRIGPCDPMALAGNLCRCTGYRPIRDAVQAVGPPPPGLFLDRITRPTPALEATATPGFSRPRSVAECLTVLAASPDAALISGGSDVGVEWNLRGRRWQHLVSLEAIDELREWSESATRIRIGAALPLSDIALLWRAPPEAVTTWLALFASPLIRNRATLGGNLATASPIGDAAPLLLAMDASVEIAGMAGRRSVPLSSYFIGYRQTARRPGELLIAIDIPKPLPHYLRFYKIAKRRLDDISTVAAAMALDLDDGGRVARARFAFGGVAATPLRATAAESVTEGAYWNEVAVERVQRLIDRTLQPLSDHRGSKEYRLEVCKSLVERFWVERHS